MKTPSVTHPPSPRTRQRILTAARQLFAQQGFHGAAVREIAQRAGTNKALIYYYFRDKDALYRAVLQDSFLPLLALWEDPAIRTASTAREKLSRFLEGFIQFHARNEALRKILALEITRGGKHLRWVVQRFLSRNYAHLEQILQEGIARGEFRPLDVRLTATSCIGLVVFNFVSKPILREMHPGSRIETRALHRHLMGLVLEGIASKASGTGASSRSSRRRLPCASGR